ncbi:MULTISPECIES: DotI/IcmL/TraM family protein [Gluconobacter]|uniref:Type IV secretion protein DotI n=2 Tax=Gluconobacter TaxID=441 RepID=A0A149S429_GLUOY|nr:MULTISPECIES: DotI/IcmL/TraM family protein [Gluconobacter]KXV21470.1 type IV secretion protein DotI [Gluconobacter oxydans]KXV49957.1 type IV secretion protein DotI [Gluconobacter albidus]
MSRSTVSLSRRLSDPDFQGKVVERCLQINLALTGVVIVLAVLLARAWSYHPLPKFFFVDGINAPRPAIALSSPILSQEDFLSWVIKWSLKPYNINYRDYPSELNAAGAHFTLNGWNTFAQSFVKEGNLAKMKEAKLLCYAQPTRAATIRQQSIVNGQHHYVVQFPFVQTCENVNQQSSQILLATVHVERVEDQDHPDGIAITQLVASPQ